MTSDEERLFERCSLNVRSIWEQLKSELERMGPVGYEFKKTSIHCVKNVAFLGVHPKREWLDLNIVLDRSLAGTADCKVEQVSKNRYHNEFRLKTIEQIDEILAFVKESYAKCK